MGDASNPFNIPGLPGYDPSKPLGGNALPAQPGASPVPQLPATGGPMDPVVKAQFIAAVPSLSPAQQQDLYDIGCATQQAATARMLFIGGGAAIGIAVGAFVSGVVRGRRR